MLFNFVYDNKDAIVDTVKDIGNSISETVGDRIEAIKNARGSITGFFGNLGSAFN
ncbi:hypothetical protein [Listeria sp. ILCC792]|uniref:hypothetical protein n=1 Tax=Listeria sp. ILCC792 TaxID=1918331 RepID=UPI0013563752|nr:hypothetical protein [Listeria sp. ILCC792]